MLSTLFSSWSHTHTHRDRVLGSEWFFKKCVWPTTRHRGWTRPVQTHTGRWSHCCWREAFEQLHSEEHSFGPRQQVFIESEGKVPPTLNGLKWVVISVLLWNKQTRQRGGQPLWILWAMSHHNKPEWLGTRLDWTPLNVEMIVHNGKFGFYRSYVELRAKIIIRMG